VDIKQDIPTKAKGVIKNDLTKNNIMLPVTTKAQKAQIELSGCSTECKKSIQNNKV